MVQSGISTIEDLSLELKVSKSASVHQPKDEVVEAIVVVHNTSSTELN